MVVTFFLPKKNFDIPHPSKEGYRLRHTCPEAPYNDVYIRGKVKNTDEIKLPDYWKDFVDKSSITVNLTPIGAHQNVIVKRVEPDRDCATIYRWYSHSLLLSRFC